MTVSWELDLYFTTENRDATDENDLDATMYHGRSAVVRTVEADSFEHGSSGTLALYHKDEIADGREMMKSSESIKDDDLIGVDATRIGEPETPDVPDEVDEENWDQGAN